MKKYGKVYFIKNIIERKILKILSLCLPHINAFYSRVSNLLSRIHLLSTIKWHLIYCLTANKKEKWLLNKCKKVSKKPKHPKKAYELVNLIFHKGIFFFWDTAVVFLFGDSLSWTLALASTPDTNCIELPNDFW